MQTHTCRQIDTYKYLSIDRLTYFITLEDIKIYIYTETYLKTDIQTDEPIHMFRQIDKQLDTYTYLCLDKLTDLINIVRLVDCVDGKD